MVQDTNEPSSGEDIFKFLGESPSEDPLLWCAYWGYEFGPRTGKPYPRNLDSFARFIEGGGGRSVALLVAGRYGTGKSSFLRLLMQRLCESNEPVTPLWLHMPVLTSHLNSSAVAAVVQAVVNCLDPEHGDEDLRQAVEDLWEIEAPGKTILNQEQEREAPRPNRMSGSQMGEAARHGQANTIEHLIQKRLGWSDADCNNRPADAGTPEDTRGSQGRHLVVFLDDLDRCRDGVATDVIRLLLRFGNSRGVHFAIASDRDILQQGADQWMATYGRTGGDGSPLVTSSSALEKYLHTIAELPSLDSACFSDDPAVLNSLHPPHSGAVSELLDSGLKEYLDPLRPDQTPGIRLMDLFAQLLAARVRRQDLFSTPIPESVLSPNSGSDDIGAVPDQAPGNVSRRDGTQDARPASETGSNPLPYASDNGGNLGQESDADSTRPAEKDSDAHKPIENKEDKEKSKEALENRTSLLLALQDIFGIANDEQRTMRVKQKYSEIVRYLTLRQFKFLLRERLVLSLSREEANDNHQPLPGGFHERLLKQLFYPFWRMKQWDRWLYDQLSRTAFCFRGYGQALSGPIRGEMDEGVLAMFYRELKRLCDVANSIRPDELERHWPRRRHERAMLLLLLAGDGGAYTGSGAGDVGTSAPGVPPREGAARAGEAGTEPRAMTGETGTPSFLLGDPEFTQWARKTLGQPLSGENLAEQVSNFQDVLIRKLGQGAKAAAVVSGYVDGFLDRHRRFLSRSSATTMANLAIVLNDQAGMEGPCDRLFRLAEELDPDVMRITLAHADFLLDVLAEPRKVANLKATGAYPGEAAVRSKVAELIAAAEASKEPEPAFRAAVYGTILNLGDSQKRTSAETPRDLAMQLIASQSDNLKRLWQEAPAAGTARLSSAFDKILGSRNSDAIRNKGQALAVLWGLADSLRLPNWPIRRSIANNYVGESTNKSHQEMLGLRINRGLLTDPRMLAAPGEEGRTGAIWSQSALALARLLSKTQAHRLLLAILIALAYEARGNTVTRAQALWATLFPDQAFSIEAMERKLNAEDQELLARLRPDLGNIEVAEAAVNRVFSDTVGAPIIVWTELAEAEPWAETDRKVVEHYLAQAASNAGHTENGAQNA
ncbi:MAG: P-loop NTPase fold protein [Rhodocyclaceae bacterium]|nr:P-loop NTPase fold protein [Rhodocyclaceae bacterium]